MRGVILHAVVAALACLHLIQSAEAQRSPKWPEGFRESPIRPDPSLTPGSIATSDPDVFCRAGYSRSVRHTSGRTKRSIYRAYGLDRRSDQFEIDHLVPLALGGSDTPDNLWPQSFTTDPWNAGVKDCLELRLVQLVGGGAVLPRQAQQEIAADWIAAYGKYCPSAADCPTYRATMGR